MSWLSFKACFIKTVKFAVLFIFLYVVYRFFGISCPIYNIFGVPCPTCGMTRALVSLVKGNMRAYASYNIMAVPVSFVFATELLCASFVKKSCAAIHWVTAAVLAINLVYYLYRLKCGIVF